MKELFKTNNAVRLSYAEALLRDQGLEPIVFDRHMSILDGSIGALPRRLMVADEDYAAALRVLIDARLIEAPADEGHERSRGELDSLGALSDDGFLDGRLRILQPRAGFRAAIDSVLLPAAVSPENGLEVLDAGIGAGVASLCLLARVPGFRVTGIDDQNDLAALARENARRNGFEIDVYYGDLQAETGSGAGMLFDQVMTNPPYLDAARGTPPPGAKARSHVLPNSSGAGALKRWIGACLNFLKPHGVLTLIHRADRRDEILAALAGRAGDALILPLLPRVGEAPHRLIVRARLGARGEPHELPRLVLHGEVEKYTPEAEAILRHAEALDWSHDNGARAP